MVLGGLCADGAGQEGGAARGAEGEGEDGGVLRVYRPSGGLVIWVFSTLFWRRRLSRYGVKGGSGYSFWPGNKYVSVETRDGSLTFQRV